MFKNKDIKKIEKLDLAKIENSLIEINFEFLDILNNYSDKFEYQDNSYNFDQDYDSLDVNFDQEENLNEEYLLHKNMYHKNKK